MDKLYLTWARSRRRGGEIRPSRGSRFLHALPPTGLDERRTSVATEAVRWSGWGGGARRGGDGAFGASGAAGTAAGEESQDAPRYVKGERVRHRRFGAGTIQGLQGAGKDLRVTVAFDDEAAGTRQLLVAYAGLEREEWGGA